MSLKKKYQALVQQRADLLAESQQLLAAGRALTDEEKARDDEIHALVTGLNEGIERIERQRAAEMSAGTVTEEFERITGMHNRVEDDPNRGFASMADYARQVRQACMPGGQVDERLLIGAAAPSNYHARSGDEGYMTPPAMADGIWELMFSEGSLIGEVDHEPTNANAVSKSKDESTPWGASGVKAKMRSENEKMTASKLTSEEDLVKLHEMYVFVTAEEELMQDAPRLNDRLTRKSAMAFDWKINQQFFEGTGAGQCLGWMSPNSKALVTQNKESGQAGGTITADNIAKMYSRCLRPQNAIWFINQDAYPQLITMTIGNQPIWTSPQAGLQNAPGGLLMGRPVRFSEHCQTLGTKGDIQLVDPKGYYAVSKGDRPSYAESIHLFFDYNMKAFRWTFRINGQPHLSEAVTPNKGSAKRSHFVVLETRS